MEERNLRKEFSSVCNSYVKRFCEVYELTYDPIDMWVANDIGGVVCIGDYFFDFLSVIKYSVDNKIEDFSEILRWYDYQLDCNDLGLDTPNFPSWHKGCPRIEWEKLNKLLKLKSELLKGIRDVSDKDVEINIF